MSTEDGIFVRTRTLQRITSLAEGWRAEAVEILAQPLRQSPTPFMNDGKRESYVVRMYRRPDGAPEHAPAEEGELLLIVGRGNDADDVVKLGERLWSDRS